MLASLEKLLRQQRGSVIVIVAAAMVVLTGMAGLVVDVGYFYVQRAHMQTGVDAAAMAGAARLPDTGSAAAEAGRYIGLNRLIPANTTTAFSQGNRRLDVTYIEQFNTFFMRVFGVNDVRIRVAAAAQLMGPGKAFEYSIFSGSALDILPLNGSDLYVGGSTHSNEDLRVNGTRITITGVLEAVGRVFVNGSSLTLGERLPGSAFVDMPDYTAEIMAQAAAAGQEYSGPKLYDGTIINVDNSIHVNGDVTLNGTKITGNGAILASGDITTNGTNIRVSTGDQVCLYSENGDIHVNGTNITLDGILYAPHGIIHVNGTNITINGRIIGDQVQLNGTGIRVNGTENPVTSLPSSGVQLVL